jgi:hypothetical protein
MFRTTATLVAERRLALGVARSLEGLDQDSDVHSFHVRFCATTRKGKRQRNRNRGRGRGREERGERREERGERREERGRERERENVC